MVSTLVELDTNWTEQKIKIRFWASLLLTRTSTLWENKRYPRRTMMPNLDMLAQASKTPQQSPGQTISTSPLSNTCAIILQVLLRSQETRFPSLMARLPLSGINLEDQ